MPWKPLLLELLQEKSYRPMTDEQLARHFDLKGRNAAEFFQTLDAMEKDGVLLKTKKGKYLLPEKLGIVVGKLSMHRRGFGFVIPDRPGEGDVFIGSRGLGSAMHGDRVAARLLEGADPQKSREGEIVRVLSRANEEIVGVLQLDRDRGIVYPDDPKLNEAVHVPLHSLRGAKDGDKVVVRVTAWPDGSIKAQGEVLEVLAGKGEPGADVLGLIRRYGLSEDFPETVLHEASGIPSSIGPEELEGRRDFRGDRIITIDGADAKDLDDAVSVKKTSDGNYLLGVHIADVSHYVREGSALDDEALARGCSVYLIDKVLPMLPEKLSNGVCSLNPKTDRLTLSVLIQFDQAGRPIGHEIVKSVIRTAERMIYTDVSDMLEQGAPGLIEKYRHIHGDLLLMEELAMLLRRRRMERGGIDFDFDEPFITLNEQGIPIDVEIAERRIGNRIIEEFMLAANETVAEHFFWMEIPFIYRVHGTPDPLKIADFGRFIANFGYTLKGSPEHIHVRALNDVLDQAQGKPEEHIISTIMLRSMRKAIYSTACEGHFGLGFKYYCHFTSPIRRYPDLIVHRIIKEVATSPMDAARLAKLKPRVEKAAEVASTREKMAEDIEREVEKLKKAEFMAGRIGEDFDGVISGVVQSGFFVEIEKTIEGMVRMETLTDDYYRFEASRYRLVGDRTRKIYTIGDKVRVRVSGVDLYLREIDFELLPVRIPKSRQQQQNDGEQLKTSGQHKKRQQ